MSLDSFGFGMHSYLFYSSLVNNGQGRREAQVGAGAGATLKEI